MPTSPRLILGFICAATILHCCGCREDAAQKKMAKDLVAVDVQAPKPQEPTGPPLLEPEIEPCPEPMIMPPGYRSRMPIRNDIFAEAAAISPNGKYVVLGYKRATHFNIGFRVWNMEDGKLYAALRGHEKDPYFYPAFCSFLGDDERVITVGNDGMAIVHKLVVKGNKSLAEAISTLSLHTSGILKCALSENGRYLASVGIDAGDARTTKVWDIENVKLVQTLDDDLHYNGAAFVSISPDGSHVLRYGSRTGNDEAKEIRLWDVKAGRIVKAFPDAEGWTLPVAFSRDGKEFVLGKRSATVQDRSWTIWDLSALKLTATVPGPPAPYDPQQLPKGNTWAAWLWGQPGWDPAPAIGLWDLDAGKAAKIVRLDNERFREETLGRPLNRVYRGATAISSNGRYALVASGCNTSTNGFARPADPKISGGTMIPRQTGCSLQIHVWDLTTGNLHRTWTDPTPGVDATVFSAR